MDMRILRKGFYITFILGSLVAVSLTGLGTPQAIAATPSQSVSSSSVRVSGEVIDSTGEPLIGASVIVKGSSNGAATDLDGKFQLTVQKGATLIVSYVGYKAKEVKVSSTSMTITLDEDHALLDEVVVVGYGTQKKETLTGSVAVVGEKQFENKGTLSSPVQALQGQVPGVIITRGSSAPGDESWSMSLRGAVSKNSSEPLIIIDGVEYESVNELRLINPSDIESINFLKDAAASIYGSKAAGGVVLVTTKKAKEGKAKVDYNGSYTYKHIGLRAKAMNINEWIEGVTISETNDGRNIDNSVWLKYVALAKQYTNSWIDGNPLNMNKVDDMVFFDTDWNDVMWGDSWSTNHELAVSGGSDKNTYRFSLGYMYDDSNLKWGNNSNQRINMRLNNMMQFSPTISLHSVIAYNRQDQVSPTEIGAALKAGQAQPGFPTSTIDGKPYAWGEDWAAPNWLCELGGDNKLRVNAINISESLKWDIMPGLSANGVFGYNHSEAIRDKMSVPVDFFNYNGTKEVTKPLQKDSYYEKSYSATDFYSLQGYLNYNHTFGTDHDLGLMAGLQYNLKQYEYTLSKVKDIESSLEVPKGSGEQTISSASRWEEAIMSYYGRANYSYKKKYMLEGQFRYDGSSKFMKDNRWAFFWGASAGWRLTEESFMEGVRGWLNELKLRASYGNVGNQSGIDRYSGTLLYNFTPTGKTLLGGQLVSKLDTNGKLVSLDRTWERIHNYNVAIDFGFFNSRLSGTVEAFWKRTNNMLIDVLYPGILGDSAPTANKGKFKAWGYEGNLNWADRIGDVRYHIGGTFTYADNELLDNGGSGAMAAGIRSNREGYPLRSVWGLRYCGKIQNEEQLEKYIDRYADNYSLAGNVNLLRLGDNMFEDVNGDGKLDANDLVYLGTDDPKIQFSFNLGAEWHGFDLNVVFQGAAKRTIFRCENSNNSIDPWQIPMRTLYMNSSNQWVGDLWSVDNPDGRYPQLTTQNGIYNYNYQCSSWTVNDGSYLRLKNLTIGYTLPQNIIKKTHCLSNLRVYVTGTDLFEISHIHDGWDPEGASNMSGVARYPFLRTWTFGANVTF